MEGEDGRAASAMVDTVATSFRRKIGLDLMTGNGKRAVNPSSLLWLPSPCLPSPLWCGGEVKEFSQESRHVLLVNHGKKDTGEIFAVLTSISHPAELSWH